MSSSPTPPPSPPPGSSASWALPPSHYRNLGTMVPGADLIKAWQEKVKRRALSPRDAYAVAIAADRTRDRQVEVGYRLYWMSNETLGSQDIVARPSGYAVVGRHGSCDVVIADERVVSLRHVLVRASALDDGFPVLSVLDLQTAAGFELSDGSQQRSVAATGPVVFRIGTHSLVALPSSGRFPDELPMPVVEAGERAPRRVMAKRIVVGAPELPRGDDAPPPSRITVLPHSVDLSQRRSMMSLSAPSAPSPSDYVPTGEGYEVILERQGRRAGVLLSASDLEHGVLIGRADKCVDEGLRALLSDTISRVHVLLIREKGACHLYDVASLVGTSLHGERVRSMMLADAGTTTLQMAGRSGVTLHFRPL